MKTMMVALFSFSVAAFAFTGTPAKAEESRQEWIDRHEREGKEYVERRAREAKEFAERREAEHREHCEIVRKDCHEHAEGLRYRTCVISHGCIR